MDGRSARLADRCRALAKRAGTFNLRKRLRACRDARPRTSLRRGETAASTAGITTPYSIEHEQSTLYPHSSSTSPRRTSKMGTKFPDVRMLVWPLTRREGFSFRCPLGAGSQSAVCANTATQRWRKCSRGAALTQHTRGLLQDQRNDRDPQDLWPRRGRGVVWRRSGFHGSRVVASLGVLRRVLGLISGWHQRLPRKASRSAAAVGRYSWTREAICIWVNRRGTGEPNSNAPPAQSCQPCRGRGWGWGLIKIAFDREIAHWGQSLRICIAVALRSSSCDGSES